MQSSTVNTLPIPEEILNSIESQWTRRVHLMGHKTTGAAYSKLEIEFFVGALAAIVSINPDYHLPPRWVIPGMRGDRIIPIDRFSKKD